MARRHRSVEAYIAEIRSAEGFDSPEDGAVFYTNGRRTEAEQYVAQQRELGRACVTLELTPYGRELDKQRLADVPDFLDKDGEPGWRPVWQAASCAYARRARGKIEVFTGDQPPCRHGVFAKDELPLLLANERVTTINGVRRTDLVRLYRENHAKAFEALREADHRRIERLAAAHERQPAAGPDAGPYAARKRAERASALERRPDQRKEPPTPGFSQ